MYWFSLPNPLFDTSYSTVLEDVNGKLLGAKIADDYQWRFPISDHVPEKFKEMILATRLELSHTKDEILKLYAAHAPFGGNVVGLETASWRYFGRNSNELSWAESTMLAVLPNSPALIHPGRNRDELKTKRDRLLHRLHDRGFIDELTLELSLLEELPNDPLALPQDAPHYLAKYLSTPKKGTRIRSGIEQSLQQKVSDIVDFHHQQLSQNGIEHAAVLVLDEGTILPNTLVADVPSKFSDYSPQNFSRTYDGAVPASHVVARSLNVPAVQLLKEYDVPKFLHHLKKLGITSIEHPPEHYGLTLILGGAEATLLEITSIYASLANQMNAYNAKNPEASTYSFINFEHGHTPTTNFNLNVGSIWSMFQAMVDVQRPEDEVFWRRFDEARKVAWKTGTSFGNRDGWAIGITPDYVVGVWVGNADGEGRPELTGVTSAGPILFDVFNALPSTTWFKEPIYELEKISICTLSGHRAGTYCKKTKQEWVPKKGLNTTICPYHKSVHLDEHRMFQVDTRCTEYSSMITESRFVLPPDQALYYQRVHPSYDPLPPFHPDCSNDQLSSMKFIYPFSNSNIYVPVELDGNTGKTVFEIAHRNPSTKIFWHLDDQYLGQTRDFHQLSVSPKAGKYQLVLVDEYGSRIEQSIEIINQ
jgi:penicillin-binding protein 1C